MHKLSQELRIALRKKIIRNLEHNIAVRLRDDYRIEYIEPENKGFFTLEELQANVGGYIEVYPEKVIRNTMLFVDEEGLLKDRKPNQLAKDLFDLDLVGDIFFVPNNLLHEEV
jgi:hypothetical protein